MAAGAVKDIRRRVKSIKNTRQITKAMELVASSKQKKAKEKAENAKAYFNVFQEAMNQITARNKGIRSIYLQAETSVKRSCYCVIAGDRGLAGGYNINVFRKIKDEIKDENCWILPIGKKAEEHFEGKYEFLTKEYGAVSEINGDICMNAGKMLTEQYQNGVFDRLFIIYTKFINVLSQEPDTIQVLPVVSDIQEKARGTGGLLYEPSAEAVFEHIMPDYIGGMLYYAVTQSYVSELCSRRNAMDTATKNADEMIEELTLQYNRARQSAITQEITEIAAGANAGGGE